MYTIKAANVCADEVNEIKNERSIFLSQLDQQN